jgi:hypothetical protein
VQSWWSPGIEPEMIRPGASHDQRIAGAPAIKGLPNVSTHTAGRNRTTKQIERNLVKGPRGGEGVVGCEVINLGLPNLKQINPQPNTL